MTGSNMGVRLAPPLAGAAVGWARARVLEAPMLLFLMLALLRGGELERGELVRSITEGGPTESLSESGTLINTGSLMGLSIEGVELEREEGGLGSVGDPLAEPSLGKSAKIAAASARV